MREFKVSVIIPVVNAEKFLREAVESALMQKEVREIILIENDSLEICKELKKESKKIRIEISSRSDRGNVSANRNLGIMASKYDYIAFLDSSDCYLPNRFKKDQEVFSQKAEADVVYSSVQWGEDRKGDSKNAKIGDIREKVGANATPIEYYKHVLLIKQQHPSFHTSSLTIKKEFLLEKKLFDERLEVREDSELWRRLLRRGNFFAGEIMKPVSVVRNMKEKPSSSHYLKTRLKMYAIFIENVGVNNMYDFEKKYHIKEILRTRSKLYSNEWKRRFFFYSKFASSYFDKEKFLNKFHYSYVSSKHSQK